MKNRNGKGRKQPVLDLRKIGQTGMAQPKPVVLTKDAWQTFRTRCREIDDDQFRIIQTHKYCIEFFLTDYESKPQLYRIRAQPLKRVRRATGKKLLALFLVFEKDGSDVIDTAQYWFEPFKPWLKYWAGKGVHPKHLKQTPVNVSKAVGTSKQMEGYERFLGR